ncbi:hypothetical protein GCM10027610_023250 [Dactylosporangium cerinum]
MPYDPARRQGCSFGFVREFGHQMFVTFGTTLLPPIAEMFVRTGTTYRSWPPGGADGSSGALSRCV